MAKDRIEDGGIVPPEDCIRGGIYEEMIELLQRYRSNGEGKKTILNTLLYFSLQDTNFTMNSSNSEILTGIYFLKKAHEGLL